MILPLAHEILCTEEESAEYERMYKLGLFEQLMIKCPEIQLGIDNDQFEIEITEKGSCKPLATLDLDQFKKEAGLDS